MDLAGGQRRPDSSLNDIFSRKKNMRFKRFFFSLVLFQLSITAAGAQSQFNALKRLMHTAESLQQQKNCEKALPLYLKIFNSGKVTPTLINRINHCYRASGQTAEWVAFLKKTIKRYPANYSYQIELGKAYFLNKETTHALQTWQQVYIHRPPELMRFTLTAQAMSSFRLFDDAAETYKAALKAFPKQYNLYMQLARIYRYQLDYENAVKTYMAYFKYKPEQASYVSAMLMSMARDDEGIERIIAQLRLEPAAQNPAIQEMIAGLYMAKKDFGQAFKIYSAIPGTAGVKAASMQRFAYQADRAGQYGWSIKAYQYMLKGLSAVRAATVKYDLAQAYYRQSQLLKNSAEQNKDIDRALSLLNGLIDAGSSQRYRAAELAADIRKDYFGDIDGALKLYRSISLKAVGGNNADRLRMKIASCYFIKNDLQQARLYYDKVQGKRARLVSSWQKAELLFFNGRFKQAAGLYDRLLSQITMQDTLANNILERKFEITSFSSDSAALAEYAVALRLDRQRKRSEAAKKFRHLFEQNSALGLTGAIRAAKIYLSLGQADQATVILEKVVNTGQTNSDEAFWLLGRAYQIQHLPQKALQAYQRLLQAYPSGFHSEQAREAARTISETNKGNPNG